MQIMIDVPKEFEVDANDKFQDFFKRLEAETEEHIKNGNNLIVGNYELETIQMFIQTFANCIQLPKGHGRLGDLDMLEKEIVNGIKAGLYEEGYEEYGHINDMDDCVECIKCADTIIEADRQKVRNKE